MRCLVALRAFFRALFDGEFARQAELLLAGSSAPEPPPTKPTPAPAKPKPEKPAGRSDAISLLSALQREGRLIDFLQESLDGYTDAQIGAAVRDIHRDCAAVLHRMFALEPVLPDPEGATVDVPAGYDASSYRLTGNVTGEPPFRGTMVHHGWKATVCQVPKWSGREEALLVVAPAEVEL